MLSPQASLVGRTKARETSLAENSQETANRDGARLGRGRRSLCRVMNQPAENRQVPVLKMERVLRSYRYLTVAKEDREDPRLVRERVKCGKPSCRCAQDERYRHGPYMASTRGRAVMAFLRRYVRGTVYRERRRARIRTSRRL